MLSRGYRLWGTGQFLMLAPARAMERPPGSPGVCRSSYDGFDSSMLSGIERLASPEALGACRHVLLLVREDP